MRPALRVLALLLPLACTDGGPSAVDGTWTLTTLNGAALPYDNDGLGCCTYISGRIVFGDGEYTASIRAYNRNLEDTVSAAETGTFTLDEGGVVFVRTDFVNQPLGLYAATLEGGELRTAFGGEGPGSADEFHAVYTRSN